MASTVRSKVTVKARTKALVGNFRRCTVKNVHPHIKFIMRGDNTHEWYFMMGSFPTTDGNMVGQFAGSNDEFLDGQYIGKITATSKYPYAPPDVEMLTPTGVFPMHTNNFCIDIGKYHKNNYPATLGMDGYTKMIWAGLLGWKELGAGINLVVQQGTPHHDSIDAIKQAAAESQQYNAQHNGEIIDQFFQTYGHDGTYNAVDAVEKK